MTTPLRLLWLISLPAEVGAAWLLLGSSLPRIGAAFVLHLIAAIVFGFSLIVYAGERRVWAWPLLGWTLSLVAFPLLGMLATAVAFTLTNAVFQRSKKVAADLKDVVESKDSDGDVVARAREMEISLLDERETEPVVDVLKEEDPELKRAAIEALTKQGGADTVRLLRGLLHDPAPEARFFASISLSKLEDEIGQSILAAQRALAETPDSPEAREHLAHLYLDYALSGFLEGVTRDYYLDLARGAFEDALEVSQRPDELILQLARVHLLLGNTAEATGLLDEVAQRRPDDTTVHLARMEAAYESGNLGELSAYARQTLPSFSGNDAARELVEWWAGEDGTEGAPIAT